MACACRPNRALEERCLLVRFPSLAAVSIYLHVGSTVKLKAPESQAQAWSSGLLCSPCC